MDSSTLLTYAMQEQRWQAVETLLGGAANVVLSTPGLTEVISVARRKGNVATGPEIARALEAQGVHVEPSSTADLIEAADLWEMSQGHPGPKGRDGRPAHLSMAGALILAIAQRIARPIVTRDAFWHDLYDQGLLTTKVVHF